MRLVGGVTESPGYIRNGVFDVDVLIEGYRLEGDDWLNSCF